MKKNMPMVRSVFKRPRINEMLDTGISKGNISIAAAPGYGKTSCLTSYLEGFGGRGYYFQLSLLDNDEHYFFERLTDKLADDELKKSGGIYDYTGSMEWFKQILAAGSRCLFIFDDYHLITNPVIDDFMERLLRSNIPNLSVIMSSRSKDSLDRIPRADEPMLLEEAQLRYTLQEIKQVFKEENKCISDRGCRYIQEHTEGWPIIVHQLCGEIIDENEVQRFLQTLHTVYAANLFEKYYYMNYQESFRKLLIKMSLLPFFSLSIVKEVFSYSMDQTCQILGLHSFVKYDYVKNVFRMHCLYQRFLKTKVSFLPDTEIQAVYNAAGTWFLKNEYRKEAIRCYYAAENYDDFLSSLDDLLKWKNSEECVAEIIKLLEDIPASYRSQHPQTELYQGIFYVQGFRVSNAYKVTSNLVDRLEKVKRNKTEDILLGEAYVLLANITLWLGNVRAIQSMEYLDRAATLLPEGHMIRTTNYLIVEYGHSFFLEDNRENEVEESIAFMSSPERTAAALQRQITSGIEYLYAAKAYYEQYKLEQAHVACYQALRTAKRDKQHDVAIYAIFVLLKIWICRSNYEMVQKCLSEVKEYAVQYPYESVVELADAIYAWYGIYVDEPDQIQSWISKYNNNILAGTPIKFSRNTILSAVRLAEKNRNLQLAYELIIRVEASLSENGECVTKILLDLAKAKYYLRVQNTQMAKTCFLEACRLSYPNRILMPFLQMGNVIQSFKDIVDESALRQEEKNWLDTIYQKTKETEKSMYIIAKQSQSEKKKERGNSCDLTKRENQVLAFLAEGWTSNEIAHTMGISINGVKKHLTRIYTKLGAVNRADAIHIASKKGLFD